jgi:eukaryotic-like serine/threonine-protein kinase
VADVPKTETLPTSPSAGEVTDAQTLPRSTDRTAIGAGTSIDRFVVLEPIGSGGMGVVVAAHDTMLDRKVALKLVRADRYPKSRQADGQARLLREARAMARLADHPNIIKIHEVGLHEGNIFIAMELVDGGTLRTWIAEKPRSWREIVRVFIAAGEGLAAAHRAGLVHRDFKPDNVLCGRDGRIRVTDFGIVVGDTLDSSPELLELPPDDRTPTITTETGVLLGTPSYMAPEQHRHASVDPRADQFSFCVSLYEALYGTRPFVAPTVEALSQLMRKGAVPDPPDRDVPRWLRDLVLRGLSADPAKRFPSMDALLAPLRRDRRAVWRRAGVGVAVAAVAGVGVWLAQPSAPACGRGEDRLAGLWDDAAKAKLRAAFDATELPYAAEAMTQVSQAIDTYLRGWSTAYHEACVATRVRGEQSPGLLDRQMACLDRRARSLRTLVQSLTVEPSLDRAVSSVGALPSTSSCRATEGHDVAPLPEGEAVRARIEVARRQVEELDTLQILGRFALAAQRLGRVDEEVRATGYLPLLAELLHVRAVIEAEIGEAEAAERTVREAIQIAAAAPDDERAAELWIALLEIIGTRQRRHDEALALRPVIEAALTRSGNSQILHAHYLVNVAAVLSDRGDVHAAEPILARAVTLSESGGDSPPDLGKALQAHGLALHRLGRYREARGLFERALTACEASFGPHHPCAASILEGLGNTLRAMGDFPTALEVLQRALAIRVAALGPAHRLVGASYRALATTESAAGRDPEAEADFRRALAIAETEHDHAEVVAVLNNLANLLMNRERASEAIPLYGRALDVARRSFPADHPEIGVLLLGRGEAHTGLGRHRDAEADYRAAEAQLAKRLPAEHPYHAGPLGALGQCLLAQDRPAEAIAPLEAALSVTLAHPIEGIDANHLRFLLARALWAARRDRDRATALAKEARARFEAAGDQARVAEVDRWLKER